MCEKHIRQAEKKWMEGVLRYAGALFKNHWMPSHDLTHLQRVWNNAKKLLRQTRQEEESVTEQVMLASFFHDLGLIYDPSDRHGRKSRELCEAYLAANQTSVNFETDLLFEAIELHDDKEYTRNADHNLIYRYLTVADDQDALGALGLYRYLEIFLVRGIADAEIPRNIFRNASLRMQKIKVLLNEWGISAAEDEMRFGTLKRFLVDESYSEPPVMLVKWVDREIVSIKADPYNSMQQVFTDRTAMRRIKDFSREVMHEAQI